MLHGCCAYEPCSHGPGRRTHPFQCTSTVNKHGFYHQVCICSTFTLILCSQLFIALLQFSKWHCIVLRVMLQYR